MEKQTIVVFMSVLATVPLIAASFQELGDLPGGDFMSEAYDVSEDGSVVVGRSCNYVVPDIMPFSYYRAFRWTKLGGMTPIYNPSAQLTSYACAYGVSADGSSLAGEASTGTSDLQAFRWDTSSGFQGLGGKKAMDISANGEVVVGRTSTRAFRWTSSSGIVNIGTLYGSDSKSYAHGVSEDGSVVVGYCFSRDDPYQAFVWTDPNGMVGLGDLPGGDFYSIANAASDDGKVVVGYSKSDVGKVPFRWTQTEGMVSLGTVPGYTTSGLYAEATNSDGTIIVGYGYGSGVGYIAYIWDQVNGMRLLQDVLENEYGLDLSGWTLTAARAISANGLYVVGDGTNPSGQREAWLASMIFLGDTEPDGDVDMYDYAVLANNWLSTDCDDYNCADFSGNGVVNFEDLCLMAANWLEGTQ